MSLDRSLFVLGLIGFVLWVLDPVHVLGVLDPVDVLGVLDPVDVVGVTESWDFSSIRDLNKENN